MADEKQPETNQEVMSQQLREYFDRVVDGDEKKIDWRKHPELTDFDEEDEEDYDSSGENSDVKKEDNEDNHFLVRKSEDDIKFSTKIVAFNKEGKFLIMADSGSDWWDLPGGHVEDGETPDDGLVREVREEAGLEIENFEAQLTTELVLGEEEKPVLFYMGEAIGEPKMSEEHTEFKWVTLEESKEYNLGVFHDVIEELFEDGYPGGIVTFPLEKEMLQSFDLGGYEKNLDHAHITLAYVKYGEMPHDVWKQDINELVQLIGPPPMEGIISGAHIFEAHENPEEVNVLVALLDVPGLREWHLKLVEMIEAEGFKMNETNDFTPHITLDFIENREDIPQVEIPKQEITFPSVEIWTNNKQHTIDFVNTSGEPVEN